MYFKSLSNFFASFVSLSVSSVLRFVFSRALNYDMLFKDLSNSVVLLFSCFDLLATFVDQLASNFVFSRASQYIPNFLFRSTFLTQPPAFVFQQSSDHRAGLASFEAPPSSAEPSTIARVFPGAQALDHLFYMGCAPLHIERSLALSR
jgi:hypothetical protein